MAKKAIVCTTYQQDWAVTWVGAFAEGLRKHGWEVTFSHDWGKCDLLVMWGVRRKNLIEKQKEAGKEVCIMERAYLGDRLKEWASVSFGGGLNGKGVFRGPFSDGSRWQRYFSDLMKPWKNDDTGYVLLCGQVPGDRSVFGVDLSKFYKNAVTAFTMHGYEVKIRSHPQAPLRSDFGAPYIKGDWEDAIRGASMSVSYNSNSGVLSILEGVPTIAMDEGSMVWEVAGHKLEPAPKPDRTAWAHALAWKQWRKEEIASGECWEAVKCAQED